MPDSFEEQYADLLDRLGPVDRRAVVRSITNGILEGWQPTREQVETQVQRAAGELSDEQFHDRILSHARRARRSREHARA